MGVSVDVKVTGGKKFAEVLRKAAKVANGTGVRVGILEGRTREDTGQSIAEYAAYNEFGTDKIPARPFLRSTVHEHGAQWGRVLGNEIQGKKLEKGVVVRGWETVGRVIQGQVIAKIASNMPPPNAEGTKKRKTKTVQGGEAGATQTPGTLIQDGYLINSIDYEVIDDA